MSRWMMPFWCACWIGLADLDEQLQPLAGGQVVLVAVVGDLDAPHQFHDEERPAGLGRAGVEHPAMFGWSIRASAWRSASKRAMTCRVSMPSLMTFRATRRRTGCSCSAIYTTPQPPSPDVLENLVAADPVARHFAGHVWSGQGLRAFLRFRLEDSLDAKGERRIARASRLDIAAPLLRGQLAGAVGNGLLAPKGFARWGLSHGLSRRIRGLLASMPWANSTAHRGDLVPEGHVRIAQRFNAGNSATERQVPKGRLNPGASAVPQPSLRDLGRSRRFSQR